jgi:hypothetical protein
MKGTEMIMQGVTGSKEEGSGNIFTFGITKRRQMLDGIYKYVKRCKGNRENTPAIKDHNGKLITDPLEKPNSRNSYYASLFSCESNNPDIQPTQSVKPFTINVNIIRKQLSTIGRKKSVGPGYTEGT